MPDESRTSHLAAWWRRGRDAELLDCAPDRDEQGQPLVWDFPHPRNQSPLWRLLRPWYLYPTVFIVAAMSIPFIVRGGVPSLALLGSRLLFMGTVGVVLGLSIRGRQRARVERLALRTHRLYRWRGTAAMDVAIAAALERERSPRRLLDRATPGSDR